MHRRAQMGLLALALVAGPVQAETEGTMDQQVQSNIQGQLWFEFHQEVAALAAKVAALDDQTLRASADCQVKSRKNRRSTFRYAMCTMIDGPGTVRGLGAEAAALFADAKLDALAEETSRSGRNRTLTRRPTAVLGTLANARDFGDVSTDAFQITQASLSGVSGTATKADYEIHFMTKDVSWDWLPGQDPVDFVTDLRTKVGEAHRSVQAFVRGMQTTVDAMANAIKEENEKAASFGQERPIDPLNAARFPHDFLSSRNATYRGLKVPGTSKHPGGSAHLQNGYVWLERYGVAARVAGASAPSTTEEEEPPPEPSTVATDTGDTVTSTQGGDGDLFGTTAPGLDEPSDDAPEIVVPAPTLLTADAMEIERQRVRAASGSLGLATAITQWVAAAGSEGMTPEQYDARLLATQKIREELDMLSRGQDPSDAARPRNTLGLDPQRLANVDDNAINVDKREILLGNAARETQLLAGGLEAIGLGNLQDRDQTYQGFFGEAEDMGQLQAHLSQNVLSPVRQHRARLTGTMGLLGPEDRTALKPKMDAYEAAYQAYRASVYRLGVREGYDPWNPTETSVPRDEVTEQQAAEAAEKLAALQQASEAFAAAARDRAGGTA